MTRDRTRTHNVLAERVTRLEEGQIALQDDIAKLTQLVGRQGDAFTVQLDHISSSFADWRANSGRIDWRAWGVIVALVVPVVTIVGAMIVRETDYLAQEIQRHSSMPAHGSLAQRIDVLETRAELERQMLNAHREDTFRWIRLLSQNPRTTIEIPPPTYYPE